jgi:hypothetical protein
MRKCTATTGTVSNLHRKVTIDLGACKNGNTLSWMCCRGTDKGSCENFNAGNCNGYELTNLGPKCQNVVSSDYVVPIDATTITLQIHDGRIQGDVIGCKTGKDATCCGGAGGSCGPSGVCDVFVDISDCKPPAVSSSVPPVPSSSAPPVPSPSEEPVDPSGDLPEESPVVTPVESPIPSSSAPPVPSPSEEPIPSSSAPQLLLLARNQFLLPLLHQFLLLARNQFLLPLLHQFLLLARNQFLLPLLPQLLLLARNQFLLPLLPSCFS